MISAVSESKPMLCPATALKYACRYVQSSFSRSNGLQLKRRAKVASLGHKVAHWERRSGSYHRSNVL